MNKLLYIVVAASLIPLTNLPTFASAAVATRRSAPSFGDASMIEVVDLRGRLNIFAIADDKSIWRFREPGDERRWLAETVGGSATAISHAVALSNDGLFQVWAVAPNHTISVSYERPGGAGWTSWNRVETSPAQDVAIATQPDRGTLVILRDLDGIIEFGWQKTRDSKLQNVQKIMIPAASRPVLLGIETSEAELVFLAKDRTLRAATLTDSVRPSVQTLQAPMVSGEPSTATLPGGGALLVA